MQLYYINSFYPGHKGVFDCDSLIILQMSLTVTSAKFQANLTDRKEFSKLLYNYYFCESQQPVRGEGFRITLCREEQQCEFTASLASRQPRQSNQHTWTQQQQKQKLPLVHFRGCVEEGRGTDRAEEKGGKELQQKRIYFFL